jgi:ABC-type uncharacterized transport system ATPase subunit
VIGTAEPAKTSSAELARMMVGREVILTVNKKPAQPGPTIMAVQDLRVLDDRKNTAVDGVSFEVHAGEVLGIAGVQGNGQTELVEALTGLRTPVAGQVSVTDHDITQAAPRLISELGVAHVPEDRQADGLVMSYSVEDNLVLNEYYRPPFAHGVVLDEHAIEAAAVARAKQYDVRTPSIHVPVSNLSGGNQQKVIVAREFSRPIKLLIAAQPTRGLDVGSIEYIHSRIVEKRDAGTAVLLVSNELDEILSLSDRIAVMYKGKIIDTLPAAGATKEALGLLMAGVHHREELESQMPAVALVAG